MRIQLPLTRVKPLSYSSNAWRSWSISCAVLILALLVGATDSLAYSVLTHEEIVDLLWLKELKPILLKQYPGLTEVQLKEAHAYAYGGAVIQDLGYYPFGSKLFSDMLHYVRSGDFVVAMIRESKDPNELAFALGALAHYASDITGHPAVNRSVAIQYPELRSKFGNSVRYAQDKVAHLQTEFGFDMVQVAKNRYTSDQYHDFIGFKVSKPLLERVFPIVYGMEIKDVLPREDLAIGSYRFAISRLIPQITKIALQTHKAQLMRDTPNFQKQKFLYRLSRAEYEKEWGNDYTKGGFFTQLLAVIFRVMPRIGPFRALGFKNPTPETEDLYFKSLNGTVDQYQHYLEEVRTNSLRLANIDFDTGKDTSPAEYALSDNAYAQWLDELKERKFNLTTADQRANILNFYSDLSVPFETKKHPDQWRKVLAILDQLKSITPLPDATTHAAN